MGEMTLEQKRALALAGARARAAAAGGGSGTPTATGASEPSPVGGVGITKHNFMGTPDPVYRRAGEDFPVLGGGAVQAGVADSALKTYFGAKDLVGLRSEQDENILGLMQEEAQNDPEGGKRTFGEGAGTVAQMVLPAGAVGKATKASKLVKTLGKWSAAPTSAAVLSGGHQFLQPQEGETYPERLLKRSTDAVEAAGTGAAFQTGLQLAAKPFTGLFRPTHEAVKLMDQNVVPSLQQGADSRTGRLVGGLTAGSFDTKNRIRQEIGDAVEKRITGGVQQHTGGTGAEILDSSKGYVNGLYDKFWNGKRLQLSPAARKALAAKVSQVRKDGAGGVEAGQANAIIANRFPEFDKNMSLSHNTFRNEYRGPLTNDAFEAKGQVRDRLLGARELLDKMVTGKNLTKAEQATLKEINLKQFDVSRLEDAVRGADLGTEGLNVNRLNAAYQNMRKQGEAMGSTTLPELIEPASRLFNKAPRQHESRAFRAAITQMAFPTAVTAATMGAGPAAMVGGVPIALSLLGQTPWGAKALFGQYGAQKKLAEMLRGRVATSISGALGSGLYNQEQQDAP